MPRDRDIDDLQLQILELRTRLDEAEGRIEALQDLVDRMLVFFRKAHGADFPDILEDVEEAAVDVLAP